MSSYRRVDVAVLALTPADVHLVLCGFLVHRVIKVDGVCVLQPPVTPHQHAAKHSQAYHHCAEGEKDRNIVEMEYIAWIYIICHILSM